MSESKVKDPIPDELASLEEAADFWDTHSLADYWDQTHEVEFEIRAKRWQRVTLASELVSQVAERAQQEGDNS